MLRQHQHRKLSGRGGSPQFPPSPSERSVPSTPGSSSGLRFQALHPFHGLHQTGRGSALPNTRSRRGRLRLTLRTARSHTPKGCLTLRFDPRRFPLKPAACYRASWQLPGPDLPRQATTSLSLNHDVLTIDLQQSGRTPIRRGISAAAVLGVDGYTVSAAMSSSVGVGVSVTGSWRRRRSLSILTARVASPR